MAYEMRAGQGSVFANEKKVEDWHPEYRGRVMLPDGKVHWCDVKEREGAKGKWLSIKIGGEVMSGHERSKVDGYVKQDEEIPF